MKKKSGFLTVCMALAMAAAMAAALAGCGSGRKGGAPGTSGQETQPGQSAKAGQSQSGPDVIGTKMTAMIIPIAQGDPFLKLAYAGVEELGQKYRIETKLIEALDKSEYSEQIRAMAEAGANPIYVVWDDLATEAIKIAPDFPNTKFIVVDCYVTSDLSNVKTVVVEPEEAAFIAGVVAANTTKTRQVAWIGSADQPVINKFRAGFEAGVAYADPSVKCESLYIGDANDPNKGGELAKQVIGKGADVVMHSANKAGLGVIRACEEEGVKAIGADEWQGAIDEKTVFWSALKDITGAVYQAGESAVTDTFKSGLDVYTISSGLKLYDERDYNKLPDAVKKKVDETVTLMKEGKIKIPTDVTR